MQRGRGRGGRNERGTSALAIQNGQIHGTGGRGVSKFGGGRGRGRGRGGMHGGSKVFVEPHRFDGVFIARGKEDALVTKNLVPGVTVYGEKKVEVEVIAFSFNASNSYKPGRGWRRERENRISSMESIPFKTCCRSFGRNW